MKINQIYLIILMIIIFNTIKTSDLNNPKSNKNITGLFDNWFLRTVAEKHSKKQESYYGAAVNEIKMKNQELSNKFLKMREEYILLNKYTEDMECLEEFLKELLQENLDKLIEKKF